MSGETFDVKETFDTLEVSLWLRVSHRTSQLAAAMLYSCNIAVIGIKSIPQQSYVMCASA